MVVGGLRNWWLGKAISEDYCILLLFFLVSSLHSNLKCLALKFVWCAVWTANLKNSVRCCGEERGEGQWEGGTAQIRRGRAAFLPP